MNNITDMQKIYEVSKFEAIDIDDKDSILLVCDDKATPYSTMNKIISGYLEESSNIKSALKRVNDSEILTSNFI